MRKLRYRQIHLDFHTSEHISGVGEKFSASQFQEALKRGSVDSITLFAKCHHGLSYHPTRVGQMHPGLKFDLLAAQMEACRAIDVKTPIYISAGLDEWHAWHHPEHIAVSRDGKILHTPLGPGYKALAFDTPYLDYLCEQIIEVVERFGAEEGVFLDIIGTRDNFSPLGLLAMKEAGVDPADPEQVADWNNRVLQKYYERTTEAVKTGNPDRPVFHNSGHIKKGDYDVMRWQSHLELESLPTGGWGYDHFPVSALYAGTTGYEYLGMTGKFHTTWGEFGGFKRPEALQYECGAMLAYGAKCSIGDQLHPSGEMNPDTYALIGAAYEQVERNEAWCKDSQLVADVALLSPDSLPPVEGAEKAHGWHQYAEEGAARMLLELQVPFEVVDTRRDFSAYKVVILPDEVTLEGELLEKVEAYLAGGGKVLSSGDSGLKHDKTAFALDCGLELVGRGEFDPDYIVPSEATPTPRVRGPFVVHGGAWNVKAGDGWQTLAGRRDPYFNRTWAHFCSHQHTPDAVDSPYPAAVSNGQIAYCAHQLFTRYRRDGQPLLRDLIKDTLATLLPQPSMDVSLPTAGRAVLRHQPDERRYILHLLYAVAQKRGDDIEVIEDLVPVSDIACRVRVPQDVKSVRLVPEGGELPFERDGETVRFVVPQVLCHQMVELQLA